MHVYNDTNIRSFRKHLRALEREITYQLKNDTNCCSVTSAQCHILLELDDDGQSGVTNLADRFGLDRSTLSRTVDGLVVAGLVGRVENPDDRRASLLSLTAKGKNTAIDIHTVCDDTYTALLSRIPTEKH
ncbi:MAG: winged helix-turn-helix transcriptional regulator [Spirochaetaceae bacterium]|nr:winged helix-turn-helix transcriptional regulator [Spirochaetaceae bacterium]